MMPHMVCSMEVDVDNNNIIPDLAMAEDHDQQPPAPATDAPADVHLPVPVSSSHTRSESEASELRNYSYDRLRISHSFPDGIFEFSTSPPNPSFFFAPFGFLL